MLARQQLNDHFGLEDSAYVDSVCKAIGEISQSRLTVILSDGVVIGDSHENPAAMDNHATRPEVIQALTGKVGTIRRHSVTVGKPLLYVAIPVKNSDGKVIAVVRSAIPTTAIDKTLREMYIQLGFGCILLALIVGAASLYVARRISRPIELIKRGAERFSSGELNLRLPVPDSEEIGGLAEVLNTMSSQLNERMGVMTQQRNEQDAILSSMVEGVLAIDSDDRLINLNRTAGQLIGVDPANALGRSIQEIIRNSQLLNLVSRARGGTLPVEDEIAISDGFRPERILQAHGTILRNAQGRGIGVLIVLNDVTRIRKLENVRREFVANVSHELRTPLTSIKGYVETMIDGELENHAEQQRFLDIILRQVDRLNAIIEDLLSLSRIEQLTEKSGIQLESNKILEIISQAVDQTTESADTKNISVKVSCDPTLKGKVNPSLLEQAIVNLMDNAIKFCNEGSTVNIDSVQNDNTILITVSDNGPGISAEHLPRIFERFYRVDKGRGRESGGTGLGLAIVKHIALAHGGTVEVESQIGVGSSFIIKLPKVADDFN